MKKEKKDWKIYIPLTVGYYFSSVGGIYWYVDYSSYIRTDDAVVASDNVSVSPKIMGRISKVYVEEGDSVKKDN
jgi:multidrug resistance efflux pump